MTCAPDHITILSITTKAIRDCAVKAAPHVASHCFAQHGVLGAESPDAFHQVITINQVILQGKRLQKQSFLGQMHEEIPNEDEQIHRRANHPLPGSFCKTNAELGDPAASRRRRSGGRAAPRAWHDAIARQRFVGKP
jgi:hypothetical protein